MNEIKISVIIYVKNDVSYIEKCIKSVLSQTLRDIEVIIVDGGSTDGTLDIIKRNAAADERVRVLHSDTGVGKQFNTGLKAAKGEYIGICESDDFLRPDMYETEYEIAEDNDLDFLQADFEYIYEKGGISHGFPVKSYQDSSVYNKLLYPQKDYRLLSVSTAGFWSGIYKRSFLLDNGIMMNETPGAAYQDTAFSFLTKVYGKRSMVIDKVFYEYRADNVCSSTNSPKQMNAMMTEYDLLEKRLKSADKWKDYREYYIKQRLHGICWMITRLNDAGRQQYLPMLRDDILDKMKPGLYDYTFITSDDWDVIDAARESEKALDDILTVEKVVDPVLDGFENDIRDIKDKESVVIFGAGKLGEKLWLYLAERNIYPIAFADNSTEKTGSYYCNTEILTPTGITEKYGDCSWIIANIRHTEDVLKQLSAMGVTRDNVIICPGFSIVNRLMPI